MLPIIGGEISSEQLQGKLGKAVQFLAKSRILPPHPLPKTRIETTSDQIHDFCSC